MIEIDGSFGEGGGQILRSSLALSVATGQPVRLVRIRAGREKPGLLHQHLAAVKAAAAISAAEVSGAELRSRELTFRPRGVHPGRHVFSVGTAGSTGLVLQTVLPPLLSAPAPSSLVLEGGTHNPNAPPFDFLARAFLPLLVRMGARVQARLERPGFYPAGGGRFTVNIEPAGRLGRLEILERGPIRAVRARATVVRLPAHIAERELDVVRGRLGWDPSGSRVEVIEEGPGPGNVLVLEVESENITEVFTGFGQRGVRAETVAARAVEEAERYLAAGVPVGARLADQLLLPLAFGAGGAYRTLALTRHSTTNVDVIRRFVAIDVSVTPYGTDDVLVRVEPG